MIKKNIYISGNLFIRITLCFVLCSNITSCYLLKQGSYLLRYQRKAEKISKLLEDSSLSDSVRSLLLLTKEIKKFSVDKIGLVEDKNFTKYLHIDDNYVVYVVSACKSDSFEKYVWRFPVFGAFPYKGYYVKEDALKMAGKLKKKGYDIYVRGAGAFSTLGIFTDPIYSYMKRYSIFDLASLIIHEQTHATIFLKNNVQFNEELATFVGDEGALMFIDHKYGPNSEHYKRTKLIKKDYEIFLEYLRMLYRELQKVYDSNLTKTEKLNSKDSIIGEYKLRFKNDYDSLFHTDNFKNFPEININNAYLISLMTYTMDLKIFYELYEKNNFSLPQTVSQLISIDKKEKKPKNFINKTLLKKGL